MAATTSPAPHPQPTGPTPGPWRFEDGEIIAEGGTIVCMVMMADDFPCLSEDGEQTEDEVRAACDAECEANGHLLAAAPDLVARCAALTAERDRLAKAVRDLLEAVNASVDIEAVPASNPLMARMNAALAALNEGGQS